MKMLKPIQILLGFVLLISSVYGQTEPHGKLLLKGQMSINGNQSYGLWTIDAKTSVKKLVFLDTDENCLIPRFTSDGKILFFQELSKYKFNLMELAQNKKIKLVKLFTQQWESLVWSRDLQSITYPYDFKFYNYNWKSNKSELVCCFFNLRHRAYIDQWGGVMDDWSANGKTFFTVMNDGIIYRTLLFWLTPLTRGLACKASGNGKLLAVLKNTEQNANKFGNPQIISLLNLGNGKEEVLLNLTAQNAYVHSFVWSPDSSYLAVLVQLQEKTVVKYEVQVIDITEHKVSKNIELELKAVGPLEDWAFSPPARVSQ